MLIKFNYFFFLTDVTLEFGTEFQLTMPFWGRAKEPRGGYLPSHPSF